MIRNHFRMHGADIFLLLLMLLLIIVVAARAIEVNRPYLCGGANRKRRGTDKDKNPFLYFGSHAFCSGSRVGCEPVWANAGGTPAATAEDSGPRRLSGLVRLERWSVSEKALLQNQFSERMRIRRPGIERSR